MRRLALLALLLAPATLAPSAATADDALPTQIALIAFGRAGIPTVSGLDDAGELTWAVAGALTVPPELGRVFFVRSDYWLGVGYRAIDVCLVAPSGACMASEESNPAIGAPCLRVGECPSYATSGPIFEREDGTWTVQFRGVTNARTEIRVFAW